jgi:L-2,4-diaminobutyrate transaminase
MTQEIHQFDEVLSDLDRRTLLHPFTRVDDYSAGRTVTPLIIDRADGVWVHDNLGRAYLDGFSSLYCVNVGYGQQRIIDAMAEQGAKLPFFHVFAGMTHAPAIKLAEKLLDIAGDRMKRVFFGSSGSDANDTQVKLVWYYNNVRGKPAKKKIIARERGYHGGTIVTATLTGLPAYHQGFDLFNDIVLRTTAPDLFWSGHEDDASFVRQCVADLEALITKEGADTIGAFIAEPMIGAGGLVPPPQGYWAAIQAVLRKHDILLILDEVVTGFGRVGAMLGCDVWDIEPDLMTLAKGLTSGYAPLSAVMVGPRVWDVLEEGTAKHGMFGHGFTYTAHPVCAAAALANIAIIEDDDLCENARDVGAYLLASLQDTLKGHPLVGQVRGIGLTAAVEFVAEGSPRRRLQADLKFAGRVNALAMQEGLFARTMPFGDIIGLAPALILKKPDADALVDRLCRAINRATTELSAAQRESATA